MSRHEGVSCDSCLKGNFRGRRYKCLVCYDYDLCSNCYESGVSTPPRHTSGHAMQCILTRSDHDLFYGGEPTRQPDNPYQVAAADSTMAYTCPFCAKLGFTEATLVQHVTSQHSDAAQEVVCPICASLPGGDPNHVTDDFSAHLTLEHRGQQQQPRDLISFLDSPGEGGSSGLTRASAARGSSFSRPLGVRRVPHAGRGGGGGGGGGGGTSRARRSANVHNPNSSQPTSLSTLSPSSAMARESVDPIAELLSQLSGVRRSAAAAAAAAAAVNSASSSSSSSSQLQQLQMRLQMERSAQRSSAAAAEMHHNHSPSARVAGSSFRSGRGFLFGSGASQTSQQQQQSATSGTIGSSGGGISGILGTPQYQPSLPPHPSQQIGVHQLDVGDNGLPAAAGSTGHQQQFLLRQSSDEERDTEEAESLAAAGGRIMDRQKKSQFVQDLILATLMRQKVTLNNHKRNEDEQEKEEQVTEEEKN